MERLTIPDEKIEGEDFIFITIHGIPHNQGWEPIAWRPLPETYRLTQKGARENE